MAPNTEELLEFLQEVPAKELMRHTSNSKFIPRADEPKTIYVEWNPVVESRWMFHVLMSVKKININRSIIILHIHRQKCIEPIFDSWPRRSYQKFCDQCDYTVWRHVARELRHSLPRFSLNLCLVHFSQQEWLCFTTKEFQNSSILENFNENFWVEFPFNGYKPDLDSDVSSLHCIDSYQKRSKWGISRFVMNDNDAAM